MSLKQIEIDVADCCIRVRNVKTPANPYEYYALEGIKSVTASFQPGYAPRDPVTNQLERAYFHTDLIVISINFHNEHENPSLRFDIQDVSNQAGWTADLAGLNQATADVCDWITACNASAGGGGAGLATETTLALIEDRISGSLTPFEYDELTITYVAAGNGIGEIDTVVYELLASTVGTLTMSYDASDRLINVIRT